jgi:hypothetical protein
MFFAFAGAAIETAMSAAYNLSQFLGWPWGKFRPPQQASRFTLSWIVVFVLATLVVLTGIDPIKVVEYQRRRPGWGRRLLQCRIPPDRAAVPKQAHCVMRARVLGATAAGAPRAAPGTPRRLPPARQKR